MSSEGANLTCDLGKKFTWKKKTDFSLDLQIKWKSKKERTRRIGIVWTQRIRFNEYWYQELDFETTFPGIFKGVKYSESGFHFLGGVRLYSLDGVVFKVWL